MPDALGFGLMLMAVPRSIFTWRARAQAESAAKSRWGLLIVAALAGAAVAQTANRPQAGGAPSEPGQARTFDAVSIRPAEPNLRVFGRILDPARLIYPAVTLQKLISDAYSLQPWQLGAGPGWVTQDRFAIEAESTAPADAAAMMLMLRQALADKFGLRLGQATRPGDVYRLEVASGGVKLSTKPLEKVPGMPTLGKLPTADGATLPIINYTLRTNKYGNDGRNTTTVDKILLGQQATVTDLARGLSNFLRAPVADATGITGKYNFSLKFGDGALPSALKEQLGLNLVKTHGSYAVYTIVAAHRPLGN
ncbi:MAG: TIGR03435 family protein [Terriglobales bacterium]